MLGVRPRLWRPPWALSLRRRRPWRKDLGLELVSWSSTPMTGAGTAHRRCSPVRASIFDRGGDPHARRARSGRQALGLRRDRRPDRTARYARALSRANRTRSTIPMPRSGADDGERTTENGSIYRHGEPRADGDGLSLFSPESPPAPPNAMPARLSRGPLEISRRPYLQWPHLTPTTGSKRRSSFAEEWRVLRAVARADGSVGRILDGHFNGVERLGVGSRTVALQGTRGRRLRRLRLGVWGADPIPGEGHRPGSSSNGRYSLEGVKTFCSGATGLDRALVAVRAPAGEPAGPRCSRTLTSEGVEIDDGWFKVGDARWRATA